MTYYKLLVLCDTVQVTGHANALHPNHNMSKHVMTYKYCSSCRIEKTTSDFGFDKNRKDFLKLHCKKCTKEYQSAYVKSKIGVASRIYGNQRATSKKRNHVMPSYTKAVFTNWLFSKSEFHRLFDIWASSGYLMDKKPSCDRLDDYKPYALDNLQITTWHENKARGWSDRVNGINNKHSKAVIQMTLEGLFLAEHHSANHAGRVTNIHQGSISNCCLKKSKTAGDFIWRFK